jgi:hypothetical protein
MAIFNSYVKLPEGKYDGIFWGYFFWDKAMKISRDIWDIYRGYWDNL